MGSLAVLAKEKGLTVSGSDANVYPPMSTQLKAQGIEIMEGYQVSHLKPAPDLVIIGNALSRGNVAVEYVIEEGLPYVSGPQWLAENVLRDKWVLGVAGTHGKTTTSAMLAWILEFASLKPGFLIGGVTNNFPDSARLGDSQFFVVEADEYDSAFFDKRSKFIHYKPDTLIINNLEFDHADIFPDISYIYREFHHLIRTLKEEARIIFPTDDLNISKVLNMGCWSKLISYGINGQHENSISFSEDNTPILLRIAGDEGQLDWTMLGEHNARNAITAVLAAKQYGIEMKDALNSLKKFKGVAKRQDLLFEDHRLVLIEDFAHHPTAIKSTLEGIKKKFPNKRLIAAIELRSNTMKSGFHDNNLVEAVAVADKVFWKSEDFTQTEKLVGAVPSKSSQIINISEFVKEFKKLNQADDLLVVMSNGNFDNLTKLLLKEYKND